MNWLKQPGPFGFPRYGWIAGVGAFLVAGWFFLRARSATTNASGSGTPASVVGGMPWYGNNPPYPYPSGGDGTTPPPNPPITQPGTTSSAPPSWIAPLLKPCPPGMTGVGQPWCACLPGTIPDPAGGGFKCMPAPPQANSQQSSGTIITPTNQQMYGTVLGGAPSRIYSSTSVAPPVSVR